MIGIRENIVRETMARTQLTLSPVKSHYQFISWITAAKISSIYEAKIRSKKKFHLSLRSIQ